MNIIKSFIVYPRRSASLWSFSLSSVGRRIVVCSRSGWFTFGMGSPRFLIRNKKVIRHNFKSSCDPKHIQAADYLSSIEHIIKLLWIVPAFLRDALLLVTLFRNNAFNVFGQDIIGQFYHLPRFLNFLGCIYILSQIS